MAIQAGLGKNGETLFKKKHKAKRAGGMAQVIQHLPSKCEALCSIPSTTKILNKKKSLKTNKLNPRPKKNPLEKQQYFYNILQIQ
jgi:hypothetical protein